MNSRISFFLLFAAVGSAAQPALTIYNGGFAVVRESVPLLLTGGVTHASFSGATSHLEPDSVVLRDPSGKTALHILEQSYRSDAVSEGLLLSLNEGKTIDFVTRDENGAEHRVSGEIVRSGYVPGGRPESPIVKVDGKLRFELPGRPLFPDLADDTILKPTLSWELQASRPGDLAAELSYVTSGLRWEASYNLIADETGDSVALVGWVTLTNRSGTSFKEASVKLVAGEVSHINRDTVRLENFELRGTGGMAPADLSLGSITQKSFDEFHLYTLPRPITLRDGETKQVEFMDVAELTAKTVYTVDGNALTGSPSTDEGDRLAVSVRREIKNTDENHLGMPFPEGDARVYRRDSDDGRLEYVGEDRIVATAKDETIELSTGNAFDITAYRKITKDLSPYRNERIRAFEVTLHNHKKDAVEVNVDEELDPVNGTSTVSGNDRTFTQLSPQEIEFVVPLAPGATEKVRYTVTYLTR